MPELASGRITHTTPTPSVTCLLVVLHLGANSSQISFTAQLSLKQMLPVISQVQKHRPRCFWLCAEQGGPALTAD